MGGVSPEQAELELLIELASGQKHLFECKGMRDVLAGRVLIGTAILHAASHKGCGSSQAFPRSPSASFQFGANLRGSKHQWTGLGL